jgi:N-glycosylase/DNA lyase
MAHHDANLVVVSQRFWREIAEHSQMPVLTIQAIFRRVMRVERGHTYAVGS